MEQLSDRDRALLVFEERYPGHDGIKESRIREKFGLPAVRYYAMLNVLVAHPEAVAEFSMTVGRYSRAARARSEARCTHSRVARSTRQLIESAG